MNALISHMLFVGLCVCCYLLKEKASLMRIERYTDIQAKQ